MLRARLTTRHVLPALRGSAIATTQLYGGWTTHAVALLLESRRSFATATRVARCLTAGTTVPSFNIRDFDTFPEYSVVAEKMLIEKLNTMKKENTPTITAETEQVRYFSEIWQSKSLPAVLRLLHNDVMTLVRGPQLTASEFLDTMLNGEGAAGMVLAERADDVNVLTSFIEMSLGGILQKTGLARLCSTRGSGKTQLLKHCLLKGAAEAIARGGVLVVESGKPRHPFESIMADLQNKTAPTVDELNAFVVALITAHLEMMGKSCDGIKDIAAAYKKWSEETNTEYPLVVFDTVESLPQTTSIPRKSCPEKKRGFVEALAFLLPPRHGLLVAGTKRVETPDISDPTDVQLYTTARERLPALTYDGYLTALEQSWDRRDVVGKAGNMTTRCLHYLSGGSPRLLRVVSHKAFMAIDPLCAVEGWGELLKRFQRAATMSMNDREMPAASSDNYTMWALAAVASGTRLKVPLHKPMPFLPNMTWGDATKGLLFATSTEERMGGRCARRRAASARPNARPSCWVCL